MKGDTIKVVCIRTLSENNINPDFKIKGVLLRKNGENIEFEYDLPHFETSFRKSPFYRRLFNEDGSANIVRDSSKKLNGDKLKEHLLKRLPAYMVPADFVQIEKMPLTPNGKIDRRKLDSLAVRPLSYSEIEFIAPQTELEKTIANTWMEVLEVDKVGVDDNFFDIGGNSLKIISLNSKLNAALDMEISIGDLFEYITIRSFIQYLNDKEKNIVFRDIIPIDRAEVLKNVKRNRGDRKAKRKRENLNV